MKHVIYPKQSQLEDYITACQSATIRLCQRQMNRRLDLVQWHERAIAAKYNALAGAYGLDKAQQKLGRLRHQQENPTILNRWQSSEKLAEQINWEEKRIMILEATIQREIEPLKEAMNEALRVEDDVNVGEVRKLAQSLCQWSPEKRNRIDPSPSAINFFEQSRDEDDYER